MFFENLTLLYVCNHKRRSKRIEIKNDEIKKIISALIKKAVGYNDKEILEEFLADEKKDLKLIKKKVTTRFVPPDLSASKLLLDYFNAKPDMAYDNLSEKELDDEAERLYDEYQRIKNENLMLGLPKKDETL